MQYRTTIYSEIILHFEMILNKKIIGSLFVSSNTHSVFKQLKENANQNDNKEYSY